MQLQLTQKGSTGPVPAGMMSRSVSNGLVRSARQSTPTGIIPPSALQSAGSAVAAAESSKASGHREGLGRGLLGARGADGARHQQQQQQQQQQQLQTGAGWPQMVSEHALMGEHLRQPLASGAGSFPQRLIRELSLPPSLPSRERGGITVGSVGAEQGG